MARVASDARNVDTALVRLSYSLVARASTLALAVFALGCTGGAGDTTTGSGASDTSSCEPGTLECECREDQTCDSGLICASKICIDDPLVTTTGVSTTTTGSATTDSTTESSTGGVTSSSGATTSSPECDPAEGVLGNASCGDPSAPFCSLDGVCVDCSGISCAGLDAGKPVCDLDAVTCVECSADDASACSGETPICDVASSTCMGCSEHAQCETGACNLTTGACFPPSELWVDKSVAPGGCGIADGTQGKPFCEIQDAINTVPKNTPTIIRVVAAASPYTTPVNVLEARFVALLKVGASQARLEVVGASALTVAKSGNAFVDGLAIGGSSEDRGVVCNQGTVWLDNSKVVGRQDIGVDGVGCTLAVRRSLIAANTLGGVNLNTGGSLLLENSFVVNNGDLSSMVGGISLSGIEGASIAYSTIVANEASPGFGTSLHCPFLGQGEVLNSVILAKPGAISISCSVEIGYSAVDAPKFGGMTNLVVDSYNPLWFKKPASNDYHLTATAPFKDVALWVNGQPKVDFDGDMRPTVDGTLDYAGADLP